MSHQKRIGEAKVFSFDLESSEARMYLICTLPLAIILSLLVLDTTALPSTYSFSITGLTGEAQVMRDDGVLVLELGIGFVKIQGIFHGGLLPCTPQHSRRFVKAALFG